MKIINTKIPDLKIIKLDLYEDNRGFFVEKFKLSKFKQLGLNCNFVQDNHSLSKPNIIRGLHYQYDGPQGKLVSAIGGNIFDVAVDIRKNSPYFGQYISIILDDSTLFWIPAGFAHGFCNVSKNKNVHLYYKITDYEYKKDGEAAILWNDPDLNIDWPIKTPIISEKDKHAMSFNQYQQDPKFYD